MLSFFEKKDIPRKNKAPSGGTRRSAFCVPLLWLLCLINLCVFTAPLVHAGVSGPGWANVRGQGVTPEQAKAYYAQKKALSLEAMSLLSEEGLATEATSEIVELARGLNYEPKLIYEYVKNHVDYVPYFGSLKGATLTYLDGSGNDFDQASLMISLLRASGYEAQYIYGTMAIPAWGAAGQKDMQHWLGVTADNIVAVINVVNSMLINGGIPGTPGTTFEMDRVWVSAVIDGTTYVFDPAFKVYETVSGIDLTDAMGYDQAALLSAAGGTRGTDYIRNLNESALRTKLNTYSASLFNTIRDNTPNAHMEEVVGGRQIVPEYSDDLPTSLEFTVITQEDPWDEIPDEYSHTITIRHGGINVITDIATLAGRRLSLTYEDVAGAASTSQVLPADEFLQPQALPTAALESLPAIELGPEPDISPFEPGSPPPVIGQELMVPMDTSTQTWDMGKSSPGGWIDGSYSPQNINSVTIQLKVSLTSNPQGAYSIEAGAGTHNIAPNLTHYIEIRLNGSGQTPGTKTGQLRVEWWYGSNNFHNDVLNLTGVVANSVNIAGSQGARIPAFMNEPNTGTCTLKNSGHLPLTIRNLSINGSEASRFEPVSGFANYTIPAGAARQIQVRYLANAHGTQQAAIAMQLTYDGITYPNQDILRLEGQSYYKPNLSGSNLTFSLAYTGDTGTGTCSLTNNGNVYLSITNVELTGTDTARFELTGGTSQGTLSSGQTREIEVKYLRDMAGEHSAYVAISYTYDGIEYSEDNAALLPLSGETLATPLARLWLDDTLIAEETAPVSGDDLNTMFLTITHPYPGEDGDFANQEDIEYPMKRGSNYYTIIYDFGGSRDGRVLEKRQRQLNTYRQSGYGDGSREVITEALNVMGMTWMRDTTLNATLLGEISGVLGTWHHRFGVVAQESGYYIDVKAQMCSNTSRLGDTGAELAHFKAMSHLASAMEHGVLEQMQVDSPAVSTVKLLGLSNEDGDKIFEVTSDNYSAIESELSNYSDEDLATLQALAAGGSTLILPANGRIGLEAWAGKAYIEYEIEGDGAMHCGMIIGGDYYGGYSALKDRAVNAYQTATAAIAQIWSSITDFKIASTDPVDMVTGTFMVSNTDLALAGGAGGLAFKRSYFGANHQMDSILGYGWSHNCDLYAQVHSSSPMGLGTRLPADAAALITASVVILDLMAGDTDLADWMACALTGQWAMDNLTDNAVSIHLESDVLTYIRQPDGSFGLPPGVNARLSLDSGGYRLDDRFDKTILFNGDNKVSTITDADGNAVTFTYSGDNLGSVSDDFGHSLTFAYSGEKLSSVTDSEGRSVSFNYTGDNLATYTDPENKAWVYGYDSDHRITTLTNPEGITTVTNAYDSLGRVMTQTVPRQSGTAGYNLYFTGYRNIEEDSDGNQTIYHYDRRQRLIALEDALGSKTSHSYDGRNHVIQTTDPRGNTTLYEYDGSNNLVMSTDALGYETTNVYDEDFHLTDVTDPLGNLVHYDFDEEHHLVNTTVYPESGRSIETSTVFYANGLPHISTDGRGIAATLTYDAYGNPAARQTASAPAVTYTYDGTGLMTSLTDQKSQTTAFAYDNRGLLETRTDPLSKSMVLTYTNDGKISTITDRNNDTVTYAYTDSGKIGTVSFPAGTPITYTYDNRDNLIAMADSTGTTAFAYDAVNRLVARTDASGFSVAYTYDEAGNPATLTYPDGNTVTYTHDELNRLATVTDWLGRTATYTYDEAGRLTTLTQFNGTRADYTYDNANRLTGLSNLAETGGDVIVSYSFTLDGNGNRTGITQETPLTLNLSAATVDYTVGSANRLESAGTDSFAYDDEGQLISAYGSTLTFDYEHRLTGIAGETTSRFKYDGAGNRIEADRNGVMPRYIYDASGNLLVEADSENQITRYYIYGAGLLAMVDTANTMYCYHFDATGHTVALTDSTKAIVNAYAYTPFGIIANQTQTINQPFKFVGQYGVMAEDNGWYYMRARYYDPETGRFISEDPLGFDGGDVNLYVYALNNPVMFIDPLGLCTESNLTFGNFAKAWARNVTVGVAAYYGWTKLLGLGSKGVELTNSQLKSIRSLEKQIEKHQQKLDAFKANPTVRPGMENLPENVIKQQQQARIRHLETEINTFKNNIEKIKNGGL